MSERDRSGNVVIVAIAAAVSAVVSAIVVSIGVVGMLLINDNDSRSDAPQTVVALPAGYGTATAPVPAAPAPTPAPGAPAPAPAPAAAPADAAAAAPAPAPAPAAPAVVKPKALSEGELTSKLQAALNGTTSELEGGDAALPTINGIGGLLRTFPQVTWSVGGPVTVDGETMTAPLNLASPGFAPVVQQLTWKWVGGSWKLSNQSACALGDYAMLPCSVR